MLAENTLDDPGFKSLWGFYLGSQSPRPKFIIERLQDLGQPRIDDMNSSGVDKQILSLTSPGVQVFDAATAVSIATSSNDQLAEAIRNTPTVTPASRQCAPQNPKEGAKELERGVRKLGLKGAILNSHTLGEYLDDPKFWDIFAAAEALDVPIYLHPNSPSKGLIEPLLARGLDGAIYGFGVETGMHMLSIITSGAFDRFPQLKIRRRTPGRGAALLALPPRLHAPRDGELEALRLHEAPEEEGERLHEGERVRHQQRHGLGAGDPVLPAGSRHGPGAVRDGLPVPVRAGGSERDGALERCQPPIRRSSTRRTRKQCSVSRQAAATTRESGASSAAPLAIITTRLTPSSPRCTPQHPHGHSPAPNPTAYSRRTACCSRSPSRR